MNNPKLADYVHMLCTLFERFMQAHPTYESRLYTYDNQRMILLFVIFQLRRIWRFKAQQRWLAQHIEMVQLLKWETIPHRNTLSRRYKQLYKVAVWAWLQLPSFQMKHCPIDLG